MKLWKPFSGRGREVEDQEALEEAARLQVTLLELEEASRQEALTGPEVERALEFEIGARPRGEQAELFSLLRRGKADVRRSAGRTVAMVGDVVIVYERGQWHADEDAKRRASETPLFWMG